MAPIDLRSDTATRPSAAMRAAMAAAEVGDDSMHEDPTVIRLEERSAELLGKEAALYLASGTMSNLVAQLALCRPDQRRILLANSHINRSGTGDPWLPRYIERTEVPTDARGVALLEPLIAAFDAPSAAPVGMFSFENTHNAAGGIALAPAETAAMIDVARRRGVPIHLDGARIFNAAVKLGVPAKDLAAGADSVAFCISKGLGAPVGSVLCGSADIISRAREMRKHIGGSMRQAGIIAAAGIVALDTMIDRLAEDHANARWLAEQLAQIPGFTVDPARVETNLIFVQASGFDGVAFQRALNDRGIKVGRPMNGRMRFVTHVDVDRPSLERAVEAIAEVIQQLAQPIPVAG
ncbi:MAG: hypothetical protein HY331_15715 [Chloroflexi bacterium]|nr:hypothetical protein [Chloroflexota bacterium]